MRSKLLAAVATITVAVAPLTSAPAGGKEPPQTGFEQRSGESWTTHEEELEFLASVDRLSERVAIERIGTTVGGRPLHLVKLGHPAPLSVAAAAERQTILFVCTQHGNEPAGREACLKLLRDLAFTDDAELVRQLSQQTILFVPTANPDGREADDRENSRGFDINRDHLNLETPEARAIAEVIKKWKPDVAIDLHEYGPSVPVLYDDEVLYLWPRNLNVDSAVHKLAKELALDYIKVAAEDGGYSADEYGLYAAGDQDVQQTAGDEDEGIFRNTAGLRHSIGILVETRVDMDPRNGPDEPSDQAAVNRRRVDSHMIVSLSALDFMRKRGDVAESVTERAPIRKKKEGLKRSAPVYFYGADNDPPAPEEMQDPPPCDYRLSAKQARQLSRTFKLHGISSSRPARGKSVVVTMAQRAEPLIPLLLDERARRHAVEAKPTMKCG